MEANQDAKLFIPYKTESIGPDHIALSTSKGRKFFLKFFFYVFPFLLFIASYLVIWKSPDLPYKLRLMFMGLVVLLLILFLTRKIIMAVNIDRDGVTIISMRFFQTGSQSLSWNEIKSIEVLTQGGRGGGALYKLLAAEKKIVFLTIPVLYMRKDRVLAINRMLKNISGKEIRVIGVYQ